MKFLPIFTTSLCLFFFGFNNVFGGSTTTFPTCGAGAVTGSKYCAQRFSGSTPFISGQSPTFIDTPICCKSWSIDTDETCECRGANLISGGATGQTKPCNNCGSITEIKYNGGKTSGGTGGGTTTGNGVDCTASNCSQAQLTGPDGKLYCWTGTTGSCSGNTSNTIGMDTCGLFYSKCYGGKGVTNSGGQAQWGPVTCKSGYHKYIFDCYKDCSAGYYASTSNCTRCPEYEIAGTGAASGKYGRSTTNANSIKDCFMQAYSISNDTFTNDIGTYKITSECHYQ